MKIPMIGICRGSQFLCAMAGGILVQDQQNPNYEHTIYTVDGREIRMTSTHHQAAYPWRLKEGEEFKILAWANESKYHRGANDEELEKAQGKECEVVYYPHIRALGIQGHPEGMSNKVTIAYCRELLDKLMADAL